MDGLRYAVPLEDSRLSLIWMSFLATSTTWIAYRLIAQAQPISHLLSVAAYFALYGVVRVVQFITWQWTGVKDHRLVAETGGVYEESVQVRRIIHKGRLSTFNHPRPWDFLGIHRKFAHPSILLRPVVTLYCVTGSHAYFVECPREVTIHASKTSPFMYMAQFQHATVLYSMPLVHFHRLAEEVGDPKVPVLWISSTGRCGSTLLIQMLENLPGTICMSEPDVTTNISLMSRARQMDDLHISRLLQSSIRLLCKESATVERFVIKTRFNCSTELPFVRELFPDFKHLYLYRDLGYVVRSYYKFLHRDVAICLLEHLLNNKLVRMGVPFLRNYQAHLIAGQWSRAKLRKALSQYNFMGFTTALIASCVFEFQRLIREDKGGGGVVIPTLHYDDLMRWPLEMTTRFFQAMDLPLEHVPLAMSAMDHDTQKGTILSNISNAYNKKMTGRDVRDTNNVLSLLGLPDMNQSFRLPHSIHVK